MKALTSKYEMIAFAVLAKSSYKDQGTIHYELDKFRQLLGIKQTSITPYTIAKDIEKTTLQPLKNTCLICQYGKDDDLDGNYTSSLSFAHRVASGMSLYNKKTSIKDERYKTKNGLKEWIRKTLENLNIFLDVDNKISNKKIEELAEKYAELPLSNKIKPC
jgi:hypothetical protein